MQLLDKYRIKQQIELDFNVVPSVASHVKSQVPTTGKCHCLPATAAVSAAREVLRIYIAKQNLTHFSASRLDTKVL